MPSSTSSFDPSITVAPKASWLLVATALIVVVIAFARQPTPQQTPSKWFWLDKLNPNPNASLVLTGDSRAFNGLDAHVFDSAGLGPTLQFSFHGVGYDSEYLQAIEEVASSTTRQPIILLGLSTRSLTEKAASNNRFKQTVSEKREAKWDYYLERKFEFITRRFEPMHFTHFPQTRGKSETGSEKSPLESRPPETNAEETSNVVHGLSVAKANHANGKTIAPSLLADLIDYTHRWHSRGWRVYAVYVPGEPSSDLLSKDISGWNRLQVESKLATSGAIWISPPYDGLIAPDGIHLNEKSGKRLSRWLAAAISQDIENRSQTEVAP